MKVIIEKRALRKEDVEAVIGLGIRQAEFRCTEDDDFWTNEELENWFLDQNHVCLGLFQNQILTGYCLSHLNQLINKVSLENIFIRPNLRRRGYGGELLLSTMNEYKNKFPGIAPRFRFVGLTQENNSAILGLLRKLDFSVGEKMIWAQRSL